jgi:hypothetical protein
MKIAYIAVHRGLGNDDEGSIMHSLRELGHEVVPIMEYNDDYHRDRESDDYSKANSCDWALIHHHWKHLGLLDAVRVPKVFWFFDLIDHPLIPNRLVDHVTRLLNICDFGFCTDGNWAAGRPNVYHLMQGANPRDIGDRGQRLDSSRKRPMFFAGAISSHHPGRKEQLAALRNKYKGLLVAYVSKGEWVYGQKMRKLLVFYKIALALKSPTKSRYWSNRVYNTLGYGGFLIHPYCEMLPEHYEPGKELVMYHSQEEMEQLIDYYLRADEEREDIAKRGMARTIKDHTYVNRCRELLRVVEERLL